MVAGASKLPQSSQGVALVQASQVMESLYGDGEVMATFHHNGALAGLSHDQILKKGFALRAKYRVEQGDTPYCVQLSPLAVVPHPLDGGEYVKSTRTKLLSGMIAQQGCETHTIFSNAVAVQEQPRKQRETLNGNPRWRSFQEHYEFQISCDSDMGKGMSFTASFALSHIHI